MDINFDLYRVFHNVARAKSISGAAKELYLSQPAVSQSIKQLEEKLGKQLFLRTPRGIIPTYEGELLFKYIDKAYNFINAAENKFAEMQTIVEGDVKICTSYTTFRFYLQPYVKAFHDNYPNVKIKLTNRSTLETIQLLKDGDMDFGIVDLPIIEDSQIEIKEITAVQDCFVGSDKFKFLAERAIELKELANYPLLLLSKDRNKRIYIESLFNLKGLTVQPELEVGCHNTLVEFAKMGFGIACVVKNYVEEELKKCNLYEIKLTEEIPPRKLGIIYLKDIPISAAAQKFIDYLK